MQLPHRAFAPQPNSALQPGSLRYGLWAWLNWGVRLLHSLEKAILPRYLSEFIKFPPNSLRLEDFVAMLKVKSK